MQKLFIKSKSGAKIYVEYNVNSNDKGLVFLVHGLGGFRDTPEFKQIAHAFYDSGLSIVTFDCRDSIGKSEGNYENATVSSYYSDLEDVINWASKHIFYSEPFFLCGLSLGGLVVLHYAQNYPQKVKALAPFATLISGKISLEVAEKYRPTELKEWNETGWKVKKSGSKPGVVLKLNWKKYSEDRMKYDALKRVNLLIRPVLLIVGENDIVTPLETQKLLYGELPAEKELHVIKGMGHVFKGEENLKQITTIIKKWTLKVLIE